MRTMNRVIGLGVDWQQGYSNDPKIIAVVRGVVPNDWYSRVRKYEQRYGVYYTTCGVLANYLYKANPAKYDRGYGGRPFKLYLKAGGSVSFNGAWSSRSSVVNAAGFGPVVDCSVNNQSMAVLYSHLAEAFKTFCPDLELYRVQVMPASSEFYYDVRFKGLPSKAATIEAFKAWDRHPQFQPTTRTKMMAEFGKMFAGATPIQHTMEVVAAFREEASAALKAEAKSYGEKFPGDKFNIFRYNQLADEIAGL